MQMSKRYGQLSVERFPSRQAMGEKAAADAAGKITALLKEKEFVNMIFAAAPSQNEFLAGLLGHKEIDFSQNSCLSYG